jgi:ATP-dependent exoDNAse (exonuclease V) beta subunit
MSGSHTSAPIAWSEAALALFDLRAPTVVSAGAGSGKTTALVELCVRLLSGEATGAPLEPSAIAAITFTEKAAEELTERLRGAVAARAAAAGGGPEAAAWAERLRALDRMAVGTIHGFCGRLLREQAVEAGLDPDFGVLDEERAQALLGEAARGEVVAALDEGRPAARELAAGLGAAGARGGLTEVVAGLVRERATRGDRAAPCPAGAAPGAPEAARDALLAAAGRLLSARGDARTAGARELVERLGRAAEALRPADRTGAVAPGGLARLRTLAEAVRGRRTGKGEEALREARDEVVAQGEALDLAAAEAFGAPQREELGRLVAGAEARYAAAKRAQRALDFDDLLVEARALLARDAALRAELRGRLRALLVDEYQDVNGVQQALFDLLAGPGAPGDPPGPLGVAVGDLKQSIYRFRGADVGVFAGVIGRLGAPGAGGRVLHLADNHRSAGAILELVNEVSAVALRPPAGEPPRPYEITFDPADRLRPRRPGGPAAATELLVDGEPGLAGARRAREAKAIAARIEALVSGAAGVEVMERGADGVERPRRPRHGDVAVLFRRLTALGPYERALREAGIPVRVARGGGFYQAPEVRDLAELLGSLAEPEDPLAWAALLRSPLCAVSDGALLLLAQGGLPRLARLEEADVRAALGRAGEGGEAARLLRFLAAWRELHALRGRLAPHELLERAARALDLEAALLAAPEGERRGRNLAKALELARAFGADGGTAAELAARWRALAARPPREPEADLDGVDAVAVLSIHQSKGLEWPVVFVPDLGARARHDASRAALDAGGRLCAAWYDPAAERFRATGSLEAARAEDRRAASAESRRLLYVALTRARDLLVLSGEGAASGDSWRGLVEGAAAARPELVRRVAIGATPGAPSPAPPRGGGAGLGAGADQGPPPAALAPPRLAAPATLPAVRLAVTELAEYARCPRRHHLARRLGIAEPRGDRGGALDDDPARATARGTLAHAMLAEADLGAPPLERQAQLAAAASRRGYDPGGAGVARILREVARFAASPGGRALAEAAAAGRLRREVPFLLRLEGAPGEPACYLNGAIDALVLPARRGGPLLVVDYKYAMARPGSAERYRLQLLAYALAAARAHGGARVEARLQFLRGDFRVVDATPSEADLAWLAAEAPRLAAGAARGEGDRPPAALGRSEARCREDGCGFVARCHPKRTQGP